MKTQKPMTFEEAVRAFKKDVLMEALEVHGNNRTHAARALGLQRSYLQRLIRDLGLDVPPGQHGGNRRSKSRR